ncbi:MAG: DUF86 domain-containing protein [Deltaproteobacteria bacterium]|nr:DUF86 domain-containing protein [Deltaproteobacteria bacterium]
MKQSDKAKIVPNIEYIEREMVYLPVYEREIDWKAYQFQRTKRLEIERWIECIINATLDTSKMLLTVKGKELPETSREVLFRIASYVYKGERDAETFSELAKIRNTLAHRYLDIRWQDIKRFLQIAPHLYSPFLKYVKKELE